jgi:hypothetical protein
VNHGVVFDGIDPEKVWYPALSIYRDAEVYGRFRRPFKNDPGSDWREAGDVPRVTPPELFSSAQIVSWMHILDAGDHNPKAWQAINAALTPPQFMAI